MIEKSKKKMNHWLQMDLSLKGQVLLSKVEGISRLTYVVMNTYGGPNFGGDFPTLNNT
jgi:hypothetical protein